jgi:hypothetical protein
MYRSGSARSVPAANAPRALLLMMYPLLCSFLKMSCVVAMWLAVVVRVNRS